MKVYYFLFKKSRSILSPTDNPDSRKKPRLTSRAYLHLNLDVTGWREYGSILKISVTFPSLSKYAMDSGILVFFIQKDRTFSSSKTKSIPLFHSNYSLCINPCTLCFRVRAISTVRGLPLILRVVVVIFIL